MGELSKIFKSRIILLMMALIGSISIFYLFMLKNQQSDILDRILFEEKAKAQRIYDHTLGEIYQKYKFMAENLLLDTKVLEAIKSKDHDRLLTLTEVYFKNFKDNNAYLDIMHFHTSDNHSLLRLHQPDKYGDDLSKVRPMIVSVNKLRQTTQGLEVGKYGVDYRVAVPIFYKAEYLGVLEFGVNVRYIVEDLKKDENIDSILILNRSELDVLNTHKKACSSMGDCEIISSEFPPFDDIKELGTLKRNHSFLEYKNREHLLFKGSQLFNYNQKSIGEIFLVKDIDFYTHKMKSLFIYIILATLFLMIASYFVLRYAFSRLIHQIEVQQEQLVVKSHAMEKLANHDYLTKTLNRRRIDEILTQECLRLQRYKTPLSIILFDIDDFKNINDTYGHISGDKVLRILSKTVTASIRETDYFGRWGGEEFILVLPQTDETEAIELANKLREVISNIEFEFVNSMTCSFGVARCRPNTEVDAIIHNADEALYNAKHSGKNCVKVWKE